MQYYFFNFLETISYYLQQTIYILCFSHLNSFHLSTLIIMFLGGSLTSLNPCLMSILPLSVYQIKSFSKYYGTQDSLLYGLMSSTLATFFIIFIFNKLTLCISLLSPLLTIAIGLNLLQIIPLNMSFCFNIPIDLSKITSRRTISLIIGFTIGISTSNCSTPILATIIVWLENSNSFFLGILYTIFYLIGYISPVYALTYILTNINYKDNRVLIHVWNYIMPTSGFMLVGIGFFSLLEHIVT